jgi:hypothetical protein
VARFECLNRGGHEVTQRKQLEVRNLRDTSCPLWLRVFLFGLIRNEQSQVLALTPGPRYSDQFGGTPERTLRNGNRLQRWQDGGSQHGDHAV